MHYSQLSLLNNFGASAEKYIAIPAGSGSTGALKHAISVLQNLNLFKEKNKTTVFITPYEHHMNILPWV